ncbi:hypothetical protein GA855_07745 [Bifidobacterium adolescentis]|nr:hypothetical protein GA855_07745 [Bifidobacterium adolescentis]KAB5705075.1 hypothetical protein GA847_06790 [Bifidobacterium adolescentis]
MVQAGVVVEDREGALQGERQVDGLGPADDPACDGWYKYTIPDTAGGQVRMAFTNGSAWDNNSGKDYMVSGDSAAVAGGQSVPDVTPNCTITNQSMKKIH